MRTTTSKWLLCSAGAVASVLVANWGLQAQTGFGSAGEVEEGAQRSSRGGLSVGPDVTIISLSGTSNYTSDSGGEDPSPCPPGYGTGSEDCRGYSIGTNSCNIGSAPVDWCDQVGGCRLTTDAWHPLAPASSDDHSVIAQNVYRLKSGRFTQIGASFLKHGFLSLNTDDSACAWNDNGNPNTSCVFPTAGGDQLGVGCTDFYSAGLNGSRPLGRRSEVQVAGADHPTDPGGGGASVDHDQRIVIPESDLVPASNLGAIYWVEGHYVVRDDARAGNGLNNASYRQTTVGSLPALNLSLTGDTVREIPAIFAWQVEDPMVEIVQVDKNTFFVGEEAEPPQVAGTFYPDYTVTERFHAARRVTETLRGPLPFHYEYVIYNMNSDTSADSFSIDLGTAATIANVGFHDAPSHSGEPFDTAEWTIAVDGPNGMVSWTAVDMGANTNALRWGTAYSFWFDSDIGPQPVEHRLGTFKDSGELLVPFAGSGSTVIFSDDFETGDTTGWSNVVP